jgi:hypothetical protein
METLRRVDGSMMCLRRSENHKTQRGKRPKTSCFLHHIRSEIRPDIKENHRALVRYVTDGGEAVKKANH